MSGLLVALVVLTLLVQGVTLWRVWPPPSAQSLRPSTDLAAAAFALMANVELLAISGEAKRHQVYAAMLKQFPATAKRDVAYAIETVMQQRPRA